MFATVHAPGSSLLGLFSSCTTCFDSTMRSDACHRLSTGSNERMSSMLCEADWLARPCRLQRLRTCRRSVSAVGSAIVAAGTRHACVGAFLLKIAEEYRCSNAESQPVRACYSSSLPASLLSCCLWTNASASVTCHHGI
eukprot:scaffold28784_cov112-Isochrysis_galbana.AAC.7